MNGPVQLSCVNVFQKTTKHVFPFRYSGLTSPLPSNPTGGPITYTKLACDFETSAICGYNNVRGQDDFDWIRNAGTTTSNGTGPFADYTLGTSAGRDNKTLYSLGRGGGFVQFSGGRGGGFAQFSG